MNHLTDNARISLKYAEEIALSLGNSYVGTEHILLGVLRQKNSFGAELLRDMGLNFDKAEQVLRSSPKTIVLNRSQSKGLSEAAKLTLRTSWEVAREFNQHYCGTEHILYSILVQKNARAYSLMRDMQIDTERLTGELEHFLNQQRFEHEQQIEQNIPPMTNQTKKKKSALDFFGTDLTALAHQKKLDPMIGREKEIKRVITVLSRRTKNNPILIGEPGVGKTAIVEGLAARIAAGLVPENLLGRRIIMLDLAAMVAGTKYRGEFEDRLKAVMDEIASDNSLITFIDEIHLLIGAGSAEGGMDAANILKPVLARGTMRLIGATTTDEYQKSIEKDSALDRRFQTVQIQPPDLMETAQILKGLKSAYEQHHGVVITDELIETAVQLSDKFIAERYMPDKALDLLDEASAQVRVERIKTSEAELRARRELKLLRHRMEEAVAHESFGVAARLKHKIANLEEAAEKKQVRNRAQVTLTENDLASTVSLMTGIPATRIVKKEAKQLLKLQQTLDKSVIGQVEATAAVAKAIRRNRSGIGSRQRPIGSFIFLGPSGVGKTELARVLARELFDRKDALIKIDMSEFSERHTAARLVGAPAGYVGYEDGGQLTDKIRRSPYSLILFDEIEKAHPDIFNMLLQILEDGTLTDAKGRSVDFTNTVIIMTGNIGVEQLQRESNLGFRVESKSEQQNLDSLHDKNKERIMDELKDTMRPELINRIDKIIIFRALTNKEALKVLDLQIGELNQRLLQEHNISLKLDIKAKKWLLKRGYEPKNGVRGLRRVIQDEIEDKLADRLLEDGLKPGAKVSITVEKQQIVVG